MKYLIYILLFGGILQSLSAQNISIYSAEVPDSMEAGTAYNFDIIIKNNDSTSYNGPVNLYYGTDTLTAYSLLTDTVSIASLDTLRLAVTGFIPEIPPFEPGYNIIVIWPTSIVPTQDTWKRWIYIVSSEENIDSPGSNDSTVKGLITLPTVDGQINYPDITIKNNHLFIPNSFSPNNDGINDVFRVYSDNIEQIQITIKNASGLLVFEGDHINDYWDGTINSISATTGVYVYRVVGAFGILPDPSYSSTTFSKTGTILLIR